MVSLAFLLITGLGCTQLDPPPPGYAECPVCRKNGDLACLHVRKDERAVRLERDGKDFYFCSEGCRQEFLKTE